MVFGVAPCIGVRSGHKEIFCDWAITFRALSDRGKSAAHLNDVFKCKMLQYLLNSGLEPVVDVVVDRAANRTVENRAAEKLANRAVSLLNKREIFCY